MGVVAQLTPPTETIDPGAEATCGVSVRNTGTVVDQITIDVIGKTSGWATVAPETLNLLPGAEGTATITFKPPRASTTTPGEMPFGVRVLSKEDTEGSSVEEATLTIAEFTELNAEIIPKSSRGRRVGRHQIAVDNHGNTPAQVNVAADDADQRLNLKLSATSFTVDPGSATLIRLKAVPKKRFLKGPNQSLPFQVFVTGDRDPKPITLDGTMLQNQILPGWLLPVAAIVAAAAIAFAILQYTILQPAVNSAARDAAAARQAAEDAKASASPTPSPVTIPTAAPTPTTAAPTTAAATTAAAPTAAAGAQAPTAAAGGAGAGPGAAPTTAPAEEGAGPGAAPTEAGAGPGAAPTGAGAAAPVAPVAPVAPAPAAAAPRTTAPPVLGPLAPTTPPASGSPAPAPAELIPVPAPSPAEEPPPPPPPPGTVDTAGLAGGGDSNGTASSPSGTADLSTLFDAEDTVQYPVVVDGENQQRTVIAGGKSDPAQVTIFNDNGSLFTTVNAGYDRICGVAYDAVMSRIIVAGQMGTKGQAGMFGTQVSIKAYDPSGTQVPLATESISSAGGGTIGCTDVIVESGSKYLMGGYIQPPSDRNNVTGPSRWFMWRINSDGTTDTTFHSDGQWWGNDLNPQFVEPATTTGLHTITALAASPDGKIYATGFEDALQLPIISLNPDGSPNTAFDGDGILDGQSAPAGSIVRGRGMVIQPNGQQVQLVVVGYEAETADPTKLKWRVDRINTSNGSLDFSFASQGKYTSTFAGALLGVAVQDDGKILVAGSKDGSLAVGRFTTAGAPYAAFGSSGIASSTFTQASEAEGVFLRADDKIDAAGVSGNNFVMAQFFGGT